MAAKGDHMGVAKLLITSGAIVDKSGTVSIPRILAVMICLITIYHWIVLQILLELLQMINDTEADNNFKLAKHHIKVLGICALFYEATTSALPSTLHTL